MKKHPIRNQIMERLTRLGDASIHNVSKKRDAVAQTYHYHSNVEVLIVKCGWAEGLVGDIRGKLQQGMVVVLGSDVPHCVLRASDDCSILLLHIPSELFNGTRSDFRSCTTA